MSQITLKDEDDLLKQDFRAAIIEEIQAEENRTRRLESKRRYDIYKDKTKDFVLAKLQDELGGENIPDLINRVSNISFTKKIINKKAKLFKDGFKLETENKEDQEKLDQFLKLIKLSSKLKTLDRYEELDKNVVGQALPVEDKTNGKFKVKVNVLKAHLYDAIEDADDPETARVYMFSYFPSENQGETSNKPVGQSGLRNRDVDSASASTFRHGDNINQGIADSPNDFDNERIVWWSNKYHFTTDKKGFYVDIEMNEKSEPKDFNELLNPTQDISLINFSKNQDGQFWAEGGYDLIDESISLNLLLTDMYFIAKYQGMGIFYLAGKGVPKQMRIGPRDGVFLEKKTDDPDVQIGFASSNPPLDMHMSMIEQKLAYLLSTNELDPGNIQGKISAGNAQSGIHEVIKMSESVADIEDKVQLYRDQVPALVRAAMKWHNFYLDKKALHEDFASIGKLNEDMPLTLKLNESQLFKTDEQKLEIIARRRELMLDTHIDSLVRDNGDLNDEEAEKKLMEIINDKAKMRRLMIAQAIKDNNGKQDNIQDEAESEPGDEGTERADQE